VITDKILLVAPCYVPIGAGVWYRLYSLVPIGHPVCLCFDVCLCVQGRAYVRASPGPCRCFILKLSCHSINIFVGLRELGNSLYRGVVASFQLGLWDGVIFFGPARCTFVVCRCFFLLC
jgi:hypothetical protein